VPEINFQDVPQHKFSSNIEERSGPIVNANGQAKPRLVDLIPGPSQPSNPQCIASSLKSRDSEATEFNGPTDCCPPDEALAAGSNLVIVPKKSTMQFNIALMNHTGGSMTRR
jgi:hypothetical protein